MKHIPKAIAISSLFLLFSVPSAFGQSDRTVIDIPFNFIVGEKPLVAGQYLVEPTKRDSATVWVFRNKSTNETAAVITTPVRANDAAEHTTMIFRRYDNLYFLSRFWLPGENTGREIRQADREKVLAELLEQKPAEHVLIASNR
jgi:hypothetical protein